MGIKELGLDQAQNKKTTEDEERRIEINQAKAKLETRVSQAG